MSDNTQRSVTDAGSNQTVGRRNLKQRAEAFHAAITSIRMGAGSPEVVA